MKIVETSYGNEIIIPERKWNCEFTYKVRRVKVINRFDRQHPAIKVLAKQEERVYRKLVILAFSMDNFFKELDKIKEEDAPKMFDTWEKHNRMDWNEYFHESLRMLEEEVNNFSFTYAHIAWESGYSCCL